MTEINKNATKKKSALEERIKRRSILKAGAVIAPLALTLHGGIPMAHANSTGCLEELNKNIQVPNFIPNSNNTGYIQDPNNPTTRFDPFNQLTTGRQFAGEGPETHWDYLIREDLYGVSCLASMTNAGLAGTL